MGRKKAPSAASSAFPGFSVLGGEMTQYSLVGKHVNRCNIKCLFSQELHFLRHTIFPSTHYNTVTKFLTALQGRLLYCTISGKISNRSAGLEFHSLSFLLQRFSAWSGKVCAHILSCRQVPVYTQLHEAMDGALHHPSGAPPHLSARTSHSRGSCRGVLLIPVKTSLWPLDFAVLLFSVDHSVFVLLSLYFKVYCPLHDLK